MGENRIQKRASNYGQR